MAGEPAGVIEVRGSGKRLIETVDLTRKFDGKVAVEDLTITINDGEVFGFLGPNGAGKTTTIRMLCCLIEPTSGRAIVDGKDVRDKESRLSIRQNIGLLPENPGLYESLSAYQNLEFFARMYGVPSDKRSSRIPELLQALDIPGPEGRPSGDVLQRDEAEDRHRPGPGS